jgi:hypothetical protein
MTAERPLWLYGEGDFVLQLRPFFENKNELALTVTTDRIARVRRDFAFRSAHEEWFPRRLAEARRDLVTGRWSTTFFTDRKRVTR